MQLTTISEAEFFQGLNARIADLAADIEETAEKIRTNPDSSTYHIDNFMHPLKVMRNLQRLRDKARAFKENEDEDVVYVKKQEQGRKPKFYYLPKSRYDRSNLPEIIRKLEETDAEPDVGYIS